MQCPRCEGSGQCSECQGQGSVPCVTCDGSGQRSSSRGGSYPCRACQGTGRTECAPICVSCEGSGQITAQLQDKVRGKYEIRFDNTLPITRVTNAITALCIVLYVLGAFSPVSQEWMDTYLSNISGMWTQPWRLLTSAFVHAGFIHLIVNMLTLARFGPWLEGHYGSRRFVLLFVISALGGSLFSSAVNQLQGHAVMSVGASGALCGLCGAVCGAHYRYLVFANEQVRGIIVWMVIYSGVALAWSSVIDHWAHLGGFLAGFAYAWLSRRPSGR